MRRLIVIFVLILITLVALEFQAQTPQTPRPPQTQTPPPAQTPPPPAAQTPPPTAAAKPSGPDPLQLAEDWLVRLNNLSKWTLTFEGKEVGREDLVNKMMELYAPDVVAEVAPHDDEQIGPVILRGSANVRKWVDKISRTQVRLLYIQRRQTKKQFEGTKLIYSTPLPWGGVGISFEIIAAWSRREDRRKFTGPGTVFLQYNAGGNDRNLWAFHDRPGGINHLETRRAARLFDLRCARRACLCHRRQRKRGQ